MAREMNPLHTCDISVGGALDSGPIARLSVDDQSGFLPIRKHVLIINDIASEIQEYLCFRDNLNGSRVVAQQQEYNRNPQGL